MKKNNICLPSKNKQKLFEILNDYDNKKFNDNKTDILFNKNLNTIDKEIKINILKNLLTDTEINKLLYEYEIKNLNSPIIDNVKDTIKFYFNRYSYTYSGTLFSSRKWKIRKNFNDNDYFIFENTINKNLINDLNTITFITDMYNFFKRNVINYDISIEKYFDDRNSKYYFFFIFVKK